MNSKRKYVPKFIKQILKIEKNSILIKKIKFNILGLRPSKFILGKNQSLRSQIPKTASMLTIRDIKKKFGVRQNYSIKQLLSVRNKNNSFSEQIKEVPGVIEEGIGQLTGSTLLESRNNINSDFFLQRLKSNSKILKKKNGQINLFYKKDTETKRLVKISKEKKIRYLETVVSSEFNTVLEKSPKAWNRKRIKTRNDVLKSKITGIMNKITVEKFNRLTALLTKFIKSEINTKEELAMMVSLMFDKIVKETNFGPLYANLCLNVSKIKDVSFKDTVSKKNITFIHILIDQCQKEFEKGFRAINLKNEKIIFLNAKKVALGTVQFIGQLYNKGLLPDKICKVCLINLVQNNPDDLQIECAYRFLLTIGKKYDCSKFGSKHLNNIFNHFFGLKQNVKYEKRTKILMDICNSVRKNEWKPLTKGQEAKTIAEIHEDFEANYGTIKVLNRNNNFEDSKFVKFWSKYKNINKFEIKGGVEINLNKNSLKSNNKKNIKIYQEKIKYLLCSSSSENNGNNLHGKKINMSQEDFVIIKKTLIRDFLTIYNIPGEKTKANHFFFKECKNIEWTENKQIALLFFDFCYDSFSDVNSRILSLLLIYLLNIHFLKEKDVENALSDFIKFYSVYEKDIPKINNYFSNTCFDLITNETLDISFINESLLKYLQIDRKNKKNQIFGCRADILSQILKKDKLEINFKKILNHNSTVADFGEYYEL